MISKFKFYHNLNPKKICGFLSSSFMILQRVGTFSLPKKRAGKLQSWTEVETNISKAYMT